MYGYWRKSSHSGNGGGSGLGGNCVEVMTVETSA